MFSLFDPCIYFSTSRSCCWLPSIIKHVGIITKSVEWIPNAITSLGQTRVEPWQ